MRGAEKWADAPRPPFPTRHSRVASPHAIGNGPALCAKVNSSPMSKVKEEDVDESISSAVKTEVKEENEPVSAIEQMSKAKKEGDEPSPAKQPKLEVKQEDESAAEQVRLSPIELDGAGDGNEGGTEQEESNEQQLSAQKREMLTDFMAIANAEESAALSILESTNWDVNKAINFYFGNEDNANENDEDDVQVLSSTAESANHQSGPIDLTGLEISLVSWNVDGLDGNSLATRMKAVYKIISNLNPDFVFLQEVVLRELPTIDRLSKLYNIYYSNMDFPYFTAILLSKSFEVESHDVIHYQNSGMGRTLQIIKGRIGEQEVYLLNTHLESMKDHSRARKEQFQICMEKIRDIISTNPNCLLFFGGDLNIRDDEISNIPRGLADAWLASGANKQTEFTWDTRKNDNKQSFGARCRFDRIFWYGPLTRVKFSLAGQQRIRSCLCFPSDHWAVHCEFT